MAIRHAEGWKIIDESDIIVCVWKSSGGVQRQKY